MDEQKRLILAVVLSMVVLFGYQLFFVKPPEKGATVPANEQAEQQAAPSPIAENPSANQAVNPAVTNAQATEVVPSPQRSDYRSIQVSTPLYDIAISEKGASIQSFELKKYKATNKPDSPLKQLINEKLAAGTFLFDLENQSIPGLKDAIYAAKVDTTETFVDQGKTTIEFEWATAQGYVIKKSYTFSADSYLIDCDITIVNNTAAALNDAIVIAIPGFYDDEVKSQSRFAFVGPALYMGGQYTAVKPDNIKITEKDLKNPEKRQEKIDNSNFTGQIDWAGFTGQYFMKAMMPKVKTDGHVDGSVKLSYVGDTVTTRYIHKMGRLDPGMPGTYSFSLYMGPKSLKVLKAYGNNLKEAVNFGGWFNILDIIGKPLLMIMNWIYSVIPNYGIAIILLTVFIKLAFWPLGTKSYRSMNKMKKVQPLMMEIREKYKDDKQKMNQETMALYKTYKVNPAGGCLPLLVQMPIFFALYRMLYQAIELRHAPFFGWITDLSAPDRLFEFGFDVPFMQSPDGIPLMTLIMGASFFLQQKMSPTAGDPTQAKMMMLMPVMMTVLFINFPSGLVLYMFVNNLISMGQQYYIQKTQA